MNRRRLWIGAAVLTAAVAAGGIAAWWARQVPRVAATVNGEPIYAREVDRYVREIGARFGVDFSKADAARQRQEVARSVLEQLIERTLILQEARRTGRLASDAAVEDRLRKIAASFPSLQDFERTLTEQGISRTELQERVRFELTVRRIVEDLKVPSPTEQEARAYFEAHRQAFDEPERVRVRHVLVRTEAEARVALARLRRGEPFAKVAKDLSQDPGTRDRGGEVGLVAPGQTLPDFERVAFSLKPGELSEPVRTAFGYHIVQVTERLPAKKATWGGVRHQVLQLLRENKRREAFEAWVKDLRNRARIVVHL